MAELLWQKQLFSLGKKVVILSHEPQNKEYEGCLAEIDNVLHRVRVAKITPKKLGQFVAIWEKNSENQNMPFDAENSPELLSIFVFSDKNCGVFIFPKQVLQRYGIYKTALQKGKMAFRVYPSWDKPQSLQAVQTQKWQLQYFYHQAIS